MAMPTFLVVWVVRFKVESAIPDFPIIPRLMASGDRERVLPNTDHGDLQALRLFMVMMCRCYCSMKSKMKLKFFLYSSASNRSYGQCSAHQKTAGGLSL
jgi:hypothetical protein